MLELPTVTDDAMPNLPMTPIPHGLWIRMLLKSRKTNQADVARHLKEPESTVSRVLDGIYFTKTAKGQAKRDKIEAYIAEVLGVAREELFLREEQKPAKRKGRR